MIGIKRIEIVRDHQGPDHVFIHTDFPEAQYPYKDKLVLRFTAAREQGPEFVRQYFGIEPKVIEV